jgi:hypothetical protein
MIGRKALEETSFLSCLQNWIRYERPHVGLWRSLVARPSGGRKVAGSSPASPTIATFFANETT